MIFPFLGAIPDRLKSFLQDSRGNDSSKRLISWMAAVALCLFGYGLLLTMEYQAVSGTPVDLALRDSFIAVAGILATLAIAAYRKPEREGGHPGESPKA